MRVRNASQSAAMHACSLLGLGAIHYDAVSTFHDEFAKRAFRCSAPAAWNSLPKTVLSSDSVAVFKLRLKTFLFSQAFSSH